MSALPKFNLMVKLQFYRKGLWEKLKMRFRMISSRVLLHTRNFPRVSQFSKMHFLPNSSPSLRLSSDPRYKNWPISNNLRLKKYTRHVVCKNWTKIAIDYLVQKSVFLDGFLCLNAFLRSTFHFFAPRLS